MSAQGFFLPKMLIVRVHKQPSRQLANWVFGSNGVKLNDMLCGAGQRHEPDRLLIESCNRMGSE